MPREGVQKIAFQIAMLGSGQLDANNPTDKSSLHSILGNFAGLHLLCLEYVSF